MRLAGENEEECSRIALCRRFTRRRPAMPAHSLRLIRLTLARSVACLPEPG